MVSTSKAILHSIVLLVVSINLIFGFTAFRSGRAAVLVATDVAARGLGMLIF